MNGRRAGARVSSLIEPDLQRIRVALRESWADARESIRSLIERAALDGAAGCRVRRRHGCRAGFLRPAPPVRPRQLVYSSLSAASVSCMTMSWIGAVGGGGMLTANRHCGKVYGGPR